MVDKSIEPKVGKVVIAAINISNDGEEDVSS